MAFNLKKLKNLKNFHLNDQLSVAYDKLEQAGITHWPVQATALSYYCILGVVPFMALCFALAKSIGLDGDLSGIIERYIHDIIPDMEIRNAILVQFYEFIDNMISNYSGSIISFVALGIIYWSGYRILMLLETVFGVIFGYRPPRRTIHRIMDYFTIMIIIPLVLIATAAITAALNVFLGGLKTYAWPFPWGMDLSGFTSVVVILTPYLLLWMVFSWSFAYFSRGLIRWRERLLGGFITAVVFQLFLTFYMRILFALTSYSAIYAGFAAIPLFLICLYTGWVIVLAGGELTRRFSDSFSSRLSFFSLVTPATWHNTMELSNQVLAEAFKNYKAEPAGGATSFRQFSRVTAAPMPSLGSVINRLLHVGLLVRISGPASGEGPSFLPARCPDLLTDDYIKKTLENSLIEII